jgi:hypothetical protein
MPGLAHGGEENASDVVCFEVQLGRSGVLFGIGDACAA